MSFLSFFGYPVVWSLNMYHFIAALAVPTIVYILAKGKIDRPVAVAWGVFLLGAVMAWWITLTSLERAREQYTNLPGIPGVHSFDPFGDVWTPQSKQDIHDILDAVEASSLGPVYLAFGSLLGWARHGGFIPWDDDADVVVESTHVPALIQNLEKRDDVVVTYSVLHNFHKVYLRRNVEEGRMWPFVDIFSFDQKPDRVIVNDPFEDDILVSSMTPMVVTFDGRKRTVPAEWEGILRGSYGDRWKCELVSSPHCHRTEHAIDPRYIQRKSVC